MTTGGDDKDAIPREIRRIGEEWIKGELSDQEYFSRTRQLLTKMRSSSRDPVEHTHTAPVDESLHCSFCGKDQSKVAQLIAAPSPIFVCDSCVDLLTAIVAEERVRRARAMQ